jgi:hypothetical protein
MDPTTRGFLNATSFEICAALAAVVGTAVVSTTGLAGPDFGQQVENQGKAQSMQNFGVSHRSRRLSFRSTPPRLLLIPRSS